MSVVTILPRADPGVVRSYETLSLDLIRNALQSLTEAGLIMQHTSEVEGRDRLVKVDDLQGLQQLTRELGKLSVEVLETPLCVLMSLHAHTWLSTSTHAHTHMHTHHTHTHTHIHACTTEVMVGTARPSRAKL